MQVQIGPAVVIQASFHCRGMHAGLMPQAPSLRPISHGCKTAASARPNALFSDTDLSTLSREKAHIRSSFAPLCSYARSTSRGTNVNSFEGDRRLHGQQFIRKESWQSKPVKTAGSASVERESIAFARVTLAVVARGNPSVLFVPTKLRNNLIPTCYC